MSNVLDHDRIKKLLHKDEVEMARKSYRYLHTLPDDKQVMIDAVTADAETCTFRKWGKYTIQYETNDNGERVANFQPVKGLVPCGRYVVNKLLQEDGYA